MLAGLAALALGTSACTTKEAIVAPTATTSGRTAPTLSSDCPTVGPAPGYWVTGWPTNALNGSAHSAKGCNLMNANLTGANLEKAYFVDTDLSPADLTGADLAGADLTGTNLQNSNLSGADLTGADLADASLGDATSDQCQPLRSRVVQDAVPGLLEQQRRWWKLCWPRDRARRAGPRSLTRPLFKLTGAIMCGVVAF